MKTSLAYPVNLVVEGLTDEIVAQENANSLRRCLLAIERLVSQW